MKKSIVFILFAFAISHVTAQSYGRAVFVNDVKLSTTILNQLEAAYQTQIQDGHYWYDKKSGAWGYANGPAQGVLPANLNLGGRLKANASGSRTGVYVNGREVHVTEAPFFQAVFGAYYRNRYWMDAYGNLGVEGSNALVNVYQVMQQYAAQNKSNSYYHSNSNLDHYSGGDSSGFYIMGKDWSYSSF